jgi:hypothetical protein
MIPANIDALWTELKAYAADYAKSGRPLPLDEECEEWLRRMLRREGLELPRDAFDFYSAELCNLVVEYREKRSSA